MLYVNFNVFFLLTGLAFQIIRCYPELVNSVNENGLTPLHILASKPNAFKSSSRLGLFDSIIYRCKQIFLKLGFSADNFCVYLLIFSICN